MRVLSETFVVDGLRSARATCPKRCRRVRNLKDSHPTIVKRNFSTTAAGSIFTTRRENRSLLYAIGTRRRISNGRTSSAVGSSFRDPSEICSSFLRCVLPRACLPSRKARDVINKIKKPATAVIPFAVQCTQCAVCTRDYNNTVCCGFLVRPPPRSPHVILRIQYTSF